MSPLRSTPFYPFVLICSPHAAFLVFYAGFKDRDQPFDILLYSSQGTLNLSVSSDMTRSLEWKEADWQQFDDMFLTLRSQMPTVPIQTIFSFGKREDMLEFAEALPSRMPAAAGETTLHYAMEKRDYHGYIEGWCRASLDSEELRGVFRILLPCPKLTD